MHVVSVLLCVAPLFSADAPVAGTQLSYRGSMVAAKEEGGPSKKTLDLTVVVAEAGAGGPAKLLWALSESGRGKWSWLDHFGGWNVDKTKRDDAAVGPAVLYQREDGKRIVPLFPPPFAAEVKLERGAPSWEARVDD